VHDINRLDKYFTLSHANEGDGVPITVQSRVLRGPDAGPADVEVGAVEGQALDREDEWGGLLGIQAHPLRAPCGRVAGICGAIPIPGSTAEVLQDRRGLDQFGRVLWVLPIRRDDDRRRGVGKEGLRRVDGSRLAREAARDGVAGVGAPRLERRAGEVVTRGQSGKLQGFDAALVFANPVEKR